MCLWTLVTLQFSHTGLDDWGETAIAYGSSAEDWTMARVSGLVLMESLWADLVAVLKETP